MERVPLSPARENANKKSLLDAMGRHLGVIGMRVEFVIERDRVVACVTHSLADDPKREERIAQLVTKAALVLMGEAQESVEGGPDDTEATEKNEVTP